MLSILLVNLFVGNAVEVLLPFAMKYVKAYTEEMDLEDLDDRDTSRQDGGYTQKEFDERDYSVAEEEKIMEVYGNKPPAPEDWCFLQNEEGYPYWYNKRTGVSQWADPAG